MALPRFRTGIALVGVAVIAAALALLARSLAMRNAYEIVISAAVALLWAALYVVGRWGSSRLAALAPDWKPPSPFTANTVEETLVTGLSADMPWFFRLHVVLAGRFLPSGSPKACRVRLEAAVPSHAPSTGLALSLPMSGILQGEVSCRLRDIFGFFAFPCGVPQWRAVNVTPGPASRRPLRPPPQSGAEDRRSKTADDEERYYMREYAPGDRFRDINWKSSERIATLITRISPDTHEKTRRVEAYFRNYGPTDPSLGDLWLLDRAKARFAQFLRLLKESDERYVFTVYTALGPKDLETREEMEEFLELLAGLPFFHQRTPPDIQTAAGEVFVFSTECDRNLQAFIFACNPRPVTVFLVEPTMWEAKEAELISADDTRRAALKPRESTGIALKATETLTLWDFVKAGCTPLLHWLFTLNKRKRRLDLAVEHIEREYVDTRIWKK